MKIRQFKASDTREAAEIWNSVVEDGLAFPQMEILSEKEALAFFQSQSYTAVAENPATGEVVGLYILHHLPCVLYAALYGSVDQ